MLSCIGYLITYLLLLGYLLSDRSLIGQISWWFNGKVNIHLVCTKLKNGRQRPGLNYSKKKQADMGIVLD